MTAVLDRAPLRIATRAPRLFPVVRWEAAKLRSQMRSRITLAICALAPIIVVAITNAQGRPPKDSLFGRYIHQSGFAVALLILGYATQWLLPLLTSIVAGDIFASEDQQGTWKTVLTRSAGRGQLFWAKTIVATVFGVLVLLVLAGSTILSSIVLVGREPVTGLTGQMIGSGTALKLVTLSWLTAIAPMIAFTALAILLSVLTRNPAVGIAAPVGIGLLMQLLGTVGGMTPIRPLLLSTPLESWHGLVTSPHFLTPLYSGFIVCAGWAVVALTAAYLTLRNRDFTEG
jgi:ABC-2 type transport system permease protein